jgi:p-aminobenzoyl-glutamate transporter AbgT
VLQARAPTLAAYRVGDSSTNIITPLMPYFPLVVYCQRYAKTTGIGTLVSTMLPYSLSFLTIWTVFLTIYWLLGKAVGTAGALHLSAVNDLILCTCQTGAATLYCL